MANDKIDVYDLSHAYLRTEPRGEFMAQSRDRYLRGEMPNELVEAVIIQYIRKDGRIPMQLRSEHKTENPNLITFTVTGHHQSQDSEERVAGSGWRQAARRETLEEIGIASKFPVDHKITTESDAYSLFELMIAEPGALRRRALGRRIATHPHYRSHRILHPDVYGDPEETGRPTAIDRDWYLTVASGVFDGDLSEQHEEINKLIWFKNFDELYERVINNPEAFVDDVPKLLRVHGPDLIPEVNLANRSNPGKMRRLNDELTKLVERLVQDQETNPSPHQPVPYGSPA